MKTFLSATTAFALFASLAPMAWAQTPPAGTAAPNPPVTAPNFPAADAPAAGTGAAGSPATPAPATPAPATRKHAKRMSLQQRFNAANTTHDGHLTRAQATAANWKYVTRHFDAMDAGHKGYVTLADIHARGAAAHAARKQRKMATPTGSTPVAPADSTPAAPADGSPATPATPQ